MVLFNEHFLPKQGIWLRSLVQNTLSLVDTKSPPRSLAISWWMVNPTHVLQARRIKISLWLSTTEVHLSGDILNILTEKWHMGMISNVQIFLFNHQFNRFGFYSWISFLGGLSFFCYFTQVGVYAIICKAMGWENDTASNYQTVA